jgi:hypothetical protein
MHRFATTANFGDCVGAVHVNMHPTNSSIQAEQETCLGHVLVQAIPVGERVTIVRMSVLEGPLRLNPLTTQNRRCALSVNSKLKVMRASSGGFRLRFSSYVP